MHPFPHLYTVSAAVSVEGDIAIEADGLPALQTAAPVEFDGPGGRWSPETLLVAAVADCFALTFRGIARVSKLAWTALSCDVVGELDRVDHVSQFTGFAVRARLRVPEGTNVELARRILTKAEQTCLITNSLKATVHLEAEVDVVPAS